MNFENCSREYREFVEDYLKGIYQKYADQPQQPLFKAMNYSLLAGGKRLRPIFALDFCRMCGGQWKNAAPFAAAIEMIHTYSLMIYSSKELDTVIAQSCRPASSSIFLAFFVR